MLVYGGDGCSGFNICSVCSISGILTTLEESVWLSRSPEFCEGLCHVFETIVSLLYFLNLLKRMFCMS